MYVTATSPRFSLGRSTPATRAIARLLYPCRCLCRGFLQMMRTTPARRTTLQCSQRVLIDGLTFMSLGEGHPRRVPLVPSCPLFEPVGDAPAREVVGRQLHLHPVAGQDPDEVHPHPARRPGEGG